ncbi:hypothetical protein ABT300_17220, partial [Streptomyces sp. NPDC001027]|uniref:hypothetical protein n=1 Tax=Streptomyces sp. NPDC001027 TaxID=3154771 RepID=UPI003325CCDD
MSRSSHAAVAARGIGTLAAAAALAVGGAHAALACSIGDFSAVAVCDADGHGVIRVTDHDASGTPARIDLYLQLNQPINNQRLIETKTLARPTARGVTVDFVPESWYAGETFRIHVKAGDLVDDDVQPLVVVQEDTCAPGAPSASASPSVSPSPSPSAPASASPSSPGSAPPSDAASSESSASAAPVAAVSPAGG